MGRVLKTILGVLLVATVLPSPSEAQRRGPDAAAIEAYYGMVGKTFSVSLEEVRILGEWRLPTEEIPVVLFLSRRAGVSPDAIASQRDSGAPWTTIAQRYGIGADVFHVSFPPATDLGSLSATYQTFANTPRASWSTLRLDDQDLVALVNIRVLSNHLDIAGEDVLEAWKRSSNMVLVHAELATK